MPENVLNSTLSTQHSTAGIPVYDLLKTINYPRELRALGEGQLKQLAAELRAFLLDSVSQTGGHLSSNLGTVELTIALHYVFDTPHDRLVWDVGHQAYPHKVLTGRRDQLRIRWCGSSFALTLLTMADRSLAGFVIRTAWICSSPSFSTPTTTLS